jgi:nucleoside-diphosphate-sugar epimerase
MTQRSNRGRASKKAVVAGALGVSGRGIVNHLAELGDWEIVGLSRRSPDFTTSARFLAVDLLDRADVERHLDAFRGVTHVFYTALQMRPDPFEDVEVNLRMLRHTVEAIERSSGALRKVVLMEGAKYYGAHLGPYKTPAREDDPRHMPPNFYYDQEDYLKASSAGHGWSWTALRPSCICGFAVGNPMNMATVIAVYASLCRELGLPLRYPGSARAYGAIMEMTDAALLAKAAAWAAETGRCDGEAFNITNGDFQRWEHLWPRLADHFRIPVAPPLRLPLAQFMSDKESLWRDMVRRYGLLDYPFRDVAAWPFGEAIFNIEYDVMSGTTKARRFGFHEVVDTEEMLMRMMGDFQARRLIPTP